jgi:isoamylase/glycogen operon protein
MPFRISRGSPTPYGPTPFPNGVNFAVFVEDSPQVELILLDPETDSILQAIPITSQTGRVKHIFIEDLHPPFAYAYRCSNAKGALLLDPYAKTIKSPSTWNSPLPYHPVALVVESTPFDWEDDRFPNIAKEDQIIYEMHVRGFTKHPSSHVAQPGTFLGVIEKIPHLKNLGINAVEIMPMQEFNEKEYTPLNPAYQGKLFQYWGYSTVQFFSPMNRFSLKEQGSVINEFKQMVKELHRAGIEVILDIVLNHTSEGNEKGPIQSFKGLAPNIYYIHFPGGYANFSGCGNTLNCNQPVVTEFILDVLRYWVTEFHVDGFRFDLASIFYRGTDGRPMQTPPVLEAISKDPILFSTQLIAEPWDAAELYKVGSFFTETIRWSEWNGKYRDCIRRFLKGDRGLKGEFATRISGSEDIYGHNMQRPRNSINYVTCHDGFTLRDLVSYNTKHNLMNGENNRDGSDQNYSWNCGKEGVTTSPEILRLREKQMRNLHLALMVSQGIPMVLMGDEYGHTKNGNNNSWCQDNPINWFLWDELAKNAAFLRFYRGLIHFRSEHNLLRHRKFLRDDDVLWHGKMPYEPAWEKEDQFVAFTLLDKEKDYSLYVAFNASPENVEVTLPQCPSGRAWTWIANTARPPPEDFRDGPERMRLLGLTTTMESYSSILLKAL